ncbi:MAG TPA: restriction endonuclease subunit S [Rhodocyclaceae bacterium]|nr:restriction endonuclease subunit S [Rhodocyclaceae bacterium]
MASEWPTATIGDVAKIKHGFAFKSEFFTDEVTPNVLVTPGNFAIGGGFQVGKPKYYSGPLPDDYVLSEGAVVVTMTDLSKASDTLGYAAKVPATPGVTYCHNQRIGLLQVKDEQRVSKSWLHYLMRTYEYRAWIVGSASGTTVKHTAPSRIESFAFRLPPLEEQVAVAETLDALDDRIANLRQTNATLQAIAAALFKSWFVDFDGLPPEDMQESELGLIPKGWRVGMLGECCENIRKQARPDALPTGTRYIGLEHMPRKSIVLAEWGVSDGLASGKFWYQCNDILFGKLRPYFHKVGVASHEGVCSTDILVVRAKPHWFGFAAMHLFSDTMISYATQFSNGAKMPRTNWSDIAGYKVALPPLKVTAEFDGLVRPLVEKLHANVEAAATLAQLRDALLPRLISGQLRVSQ